MRNLKAAGAKIQPGRLSTLSTFSRNYAKGSFWKAARCRIQRNKNLYGDEIDEFPLETQLQLRAPTAKAIE